MGESKIAYQNSQMEVTAWYDKEFNAYVVPSDKIPIFIKERLKAEDYVHLLCCCGCGKRTWVIKKDSFDNAVEYFKQKRLEELN